MPLGIPWSSPHSHVCNSLTVGISHYLDNLQNPCIMYSPIFSYCTTVFLTLGSWLKHCPVSTLGLHSSMPGHLLHGGHIEFSQRNQWAHSDLLKAWVDVVRVFANTRICDSPTLWTLWNMQEKAPENATSHLTHLFSGWLHSSRKLSLLGSLC